jgi:hypothetical protein
MVMGDILACCCACKHGLELELEHGWTGPGRRLVVVVRDEQRAANITPPGTRHQTRRYRSLPFNAKGKDLQQVGPNDRQSRSW